jgi:hypothetical protein
MTTRSIMGQTSNENSSVLDKFLQIEHVKEKETPEHPIQGMLHGP